MRNKYKETFDKISFSVDFEQQIIDTIVTDSKISKRKGIINRKVPFLLAVCGMMICVIGILAYWNFNLRGIRNKTSGREEIQKIVRKENVEIVQSEKKDNLFEVKDKSLSPGHMLILDCDMEIFKGDTTSLQAKVKGTDIDYDVGYILDGDFFYLKKHNASSTLMYHVIAENSGRFYWCINNVSEKSISFSATIQYAMNDLVYRNYGNDVISVDGSCTIRLENIQSLLPLREIKAIYLYNFEQKMTEEFPKDTENIEYKVEKKGTYSIYALTQNGKMISLNEHVSVYVDSISNGITNLLY